MGQMNEMKALLEFQNIVTVQLSDEERTSQLIREESMGFAISALHRDGVVVLENAVNIKHMDELNSILSAEAEELARLPTTHFNNSSVTGTPTGNMGQSPPLNPRLMYEDIWANGPAISVISGVMGSNPRINYVHGNTARGGFHDARQHVHADISMKHAKFPWGIVANYYLADASPANGVTELWLGSHRDTTFADHVSSEPNGAIARSGIKGIKPELLERRRQFAPPIQPFVKKGSVMLRDVRLWHAGVSNPKPEPRIMLAFVHTPWWYQCPGQVVLPEAARKLVETWEARRDNPVTFNAIFVPEDLNHKLVKFNANFGSANKGYIAMLPELPVA